jgi:hypothetical protein
MDPTDRQRLARALTETYTTRSDAGVWGLVEQYRHVTDYAEDHPDAGSQAVASALDLPRDRIRPWLAGARPDPVRAIETAADNGWLDVGWRSETLAALTVLVAWTFSGGSIDARNYQPAWTWDRRTRDDLASALRRLGLAPQTRNAGADDRATELLPARDGAVLGRLLVALGAPAGGTSPDDSPPLPAYLAADDCPYHLRLDFARVVVRNRGVERPDRPTRPVSFAERRSRAYHRRLRRLLGDVAGDRDSIRAGPGSDTTFLTERAAAVLCPPPTFGEWLADRE